MPPSDSIYEHWDVFKTNVEDEIDKDWMSTAWKHPPTIPFRFIPGAAIPKLRRPDKFRVIWNASIPWSNSPDSAVENGAGVRLPVATNAAAELPSFLALDWLSIEEVGEWMEIIAMISVQANIPLRGRTRDFASWFRMLNTAQVDWWK